MPARNVVQELGAQASEPSLAWGESCSRLDFGRTSEGARDPVRPVCYHAIMLSCYHACQAHERREILPWNIVMRDLVPAPVRRSRSLLLPDNREAGECQWCPTGVVCSVEGMVNPCSKDDLPTPYEPVVSVNDIPVLEYLYSEFARPAYFSGYECLHLNDGYADGTLDPVDQVREASPFAVLAVVARPHGDPLGKTS